jgi:hypothetical protein
VHKKLSHQTELVLKDLMQFAKFMYGRVDNVTYWVNFFPRSRSVSQVEPSLSHVEKMKWMGGKRFGMDFMTYTGL